MVAFHTSLWCVTNGLWHFLCWWDLGCNFQSTGYMQFPFVYYSCPIFVFLFSDLWCWLLWDPPVSQSHKVKKIASLLISPDNSKVRPPFRTKLRYRLVSLILPVLIGKLFSLVPNFPIWNVESYFVHADSSSFLRSFIPFYLLFSFVFCVPYSWFRYVSAIAPVVG